MKSLDELFQPSAKFVKSTYFKGRVNKIYFADPDSDFYIFLADDLTSTKKRKIKGNIFTPRIYPGSEFVIMEGEWEKSDKYGPTYIAKKVEPYLETSSAQVRCLKNSCVSCSALMAEKIVTQFEKEGYEFLPAMDDPDNVLLTFDFLSDAQAKAVHREWREFRSYSQSANALLGLGLPSSKVKSVYSELGDDTAEIVSSNPYALALADGVTFPMADRIALSQGFSEDSSARIASILEYLLEVSAQSRGHLYVEKAALLKALNRLPSKEGIRGYGRNLTKEDVDKALKDRLDKDRVVVEGEKVYLNWSHYVEQACAEMLCDFQADKDHDLGVDVDSFLAEYERIYGIKFSEQQEQAVKALNNEKVLLLTGLPGTGKSTVTKALVRLFQKAGITFTLMAPTGIAAKRLSTVVGEDAGTIHRTLGFSGERTWRYDEDNKFVTDAVIVDEVSMVDQNLLYRLLTALNPNTILVFVGDHAQLPSVGAGNVLHELIRSKAIPRVHLTEIFRQQGASDIVLNAHRINSGDDLVLGDPTSSDTDFRFIQLDDEDEILQGCLHVVKKLYESPLDHTYQVISPTYKGPLGVDRFNKEIKEALNPLARQEEISISRTSYREEDRLMIVKNHYNLKVYNGEIGKLHRIDRKGKKLHVKIFDEPNDRLLELPLSSARKLLTLAYALTVHRTQGQEFDYVILPFHSSFSIQLQRNLLYTAVTRAKKKVFIFGQWKALRRAIANDSVVKRNTDFSRRLQELIS